MKSNILKKVFFVIVFFIIIFSIIEFIGYIYSYKFNINVARFGVPMLVDAENILKDKKLFWKFKPNNIIQSRWESAGKIFINKQGWRDNDFILEKKSNLKRIAMIGDSCTFGYRRKKNEIFANILEEKLNKMKLFGCKWDVQNFGVPGYTIHQGKVVLFDYALKYKPDYVVTMFGINDSRPAPFNDDEYKVSVSFFSKLEPFFQKLFTYRILMKLYYSAVEKNMQNIQKKPRVSVEKFIRIVNEFQNTADKNGFKYIAMATPFNGELKKTKFVKAIEKYNKALVEECMKKNIEFINIAGDFYDIFLNKKKNMVWDSCHPDYDGNIYIAEKIIEKLKK